MKLHEETNSLLNQLVENWDKCRDYYNQLPREDWSSDRKSIIGHLWWDNPNLVWVLITDNDEGYEGSQAQVGISENGKLLWEYQSHCSCNGYEDSQDNGDEFLPELSKKTFEIEYNKIPYDWENQISENIKKLLNNLK